MNLRILTLLPIAVGAAAPIGAQTAAPPSTGVTQLDPYVVTGQLDLSRESILPTFRIPTDPKAVRIVDAVVGRGGLEPPTPRWITPCAVLSRSRIRSKVAGVIRFG